MTKRAIDFAMAGSWAIYEPALQSILEIAAREDLNLETLEAWKSKMEPEAVATRQGKPLQQGSSVTLRDGVAIVPVAGPIFRYANLFTRFSGATSVETTAQEFQAVLDNPQVKAILLDVDSPGGEANGIAEFAGQIFAARGKKPIWAYVGGMGASAAYWIAAAADKVLISKTASVGLIGVVASITDTRERDAKSGVHRREFVSSQSPDKRLDPASDDGKAKIQAYVDRLATEFVADVAKYRGATESTVLTDFGQGGLKIGSDAVTAGMADGVTTFEEALTGLAAASSGGFKTNRTAAAAISGPKGPTMDTPTIESIGRDHPAIANHFRAEGTKQATEDAAKLHAEAMTKAIAGERDRILGIEGLAALFPGHDKLISDSKLDSTCSVEKATLQLSAAEKEKRTKALDDMKSDLDGNKKAPAAATGAEKKDQPVDSKAFAKQITAHIAAAAKEGRTISAATAAAEIAAG